MKYLKIAVLLLGFVLGIFWFYHRNFAYHHPAGQEMAPDIPLQTDVEVKKWNHRGYLFEALAEFEVTGRVLLAHRFWTGRESKLSPVDLTLAWGPLSDTELLKKISFYKIGRYYRYEWKDMNIPLRTISTNSANMHMIGSDRFIERRLKKVKREDIVTIRGYLVSVRATDGWNWKSSLTREDTGDGACELIWVTGVKIHKTGRTDSPSNRSES